MHRRVVRLSRPEAVPAFFALDDGHWMVRVQFELEMSEFLNSMSPSSIFLLDEMLHEMKQLDVGQNLSGARSFASVKRVLIRRLLELSIFVQMPVRIEFPRVLESVR